MKTPSHSATIVHPLTIRTLSLRLATSRFTRGSYSHTFTEVVSSEAIVSIEKRVTEALRSLVNSDPEGALFQICVAVEVTAKAEYGKSGRGSYKAFLEENLGLITEIAFGGIRVEALKLGFKHPDLATDADGCAAFQDILYHVVRCGLYHEAGLPADIEFTDANHICARQGLLQLPASLILGLVICVVVAPSNSTERTSGQNVLRLGDTHLPINCLWGRRPELQWLLDARRELRQGGQDDAIREA